MASKVAESIYLLGLPGAGKSKVASALIAQGYSAFQIDRRLMDEWRVNPTLACWTIIDVRNVVNEQQAESLLSILGAMVAVSSVVVFSFVEEADLNAQNSWRKWLTAHAPNVQVVRLHGEQFSTPDLSSLLALSEGDEHKSLLSETRLQAMSQVTDYYQTLQQFDFPLQKVMLDYLLFGLDSSKQNLAMAIWRVTGTVWTHEYHNPVRIEGSAWRWDTYGGDEQDIGNLRIEGMGLDEAWLTEIVNASRLPGN